MQSQPTHEDSIPAEGDYQIVALDILAPWIDCNDAMWEVGPIDQSIVCTIHLDIGRGDPQVIGKLEGRIIERERGHELGWSDEEIFDQSGANWDIYEQLFRRRGRLPKATACLVFAKGIAANKNILVIETLDLLPSFRGQNHSLLALRCLIQHLRLSIGLVILEPFPDQFAEVIGRRLGPEYDEEWGRKLEFERFTSTYEAARELLERHFEKLGFLAVSGTRFMVLDPARALPAVEALKRKS